MKVGGVFLVSGMSSEVTKKRVMEDLRDFQEHKINIYIEYTANLRTHLLDLIFPVSAFVHSFDSLCILAETHHADI